MGPSLSPHEILFRQLVVDVAGVLSHLVRYTQGDRSVMRELGEISGGAEIKLAILKRLRKERRWRGPLQNEGE